MTFRFRNLNLRYAGICWLSINSHNVKKEGRRVLEKYRSGQWQETLSVDGAKEVEVKTVVSEDEMPRMFKKFLITITPAILNSCA